MTTPRRNSFASVLVLTLGIGSAVALPTRSGAGHATVVHVAETSVSGGGGILDPYLQAPPPTAEDALVDRLVKLGASRDAAWDAVAGLAPWQGQAGVTAEGVSSAGLAASAVSGLALPDDARYKAVRLAAAYVEGRPVSLEGIEIPATLRERIDSLHAEGLGPELAAWLARQELAAFQAGGDRLQRIDAALDVLDLDRDVASRVLLALRNPPSDPMLGDVDSLVALDHDLTDLKQPVLTPQLACKVCPAYDYGNFIPGVNWATHPSNIGANDCRVYRFSLTTGKTYRFTLCEGGGSATFANAAIESSTYQNQICGVGPNGLACSGSLAMLDYTATYSGFFFVKVRNLDAAVGSYRLAYREITPTCSVCPAFNYGAFTPTAVYQTHSASIGPLECRVYKFTVLANRQYRFTLCPSDSAGVASGGSAAFNADLQARNASCALIGGAAPAPCFPGHEIDVTPAASGSIYVTVRGDSIADVGTYTLAYRDRTPCASCPSQDFGPFTPTTAYVTHASSIASDKCKLYRFNVTAGKTYRFTTCDPDSDGRTTGASAAFDTVIEAYNASCSFLTFSDDDCGSQTELDVTPAYTGAMYIRVRGFDGSDFGNYTLAYRDLAGTCRVCPAYDAAPANPTTVYQTAPPSNVELNGGCRIYRFFLVVGNAYRFTLCDPDAGGMPTGGSASFNTVLEVRSNTCATLATNDDACGTASALDFIPTVTGYHYVRVRGFDASESGTFTLAYRQLAGICRICPAFDFGTFTPSLSWATHPSSVAPEACRVYRFQLTAGQEYQFSLCEGGGSTAFPADVTGQDPSCAPAGASFGQCLSATEDLTIVAATTGRYYVTVAGVGPLDTGNYRLAYRNLTAACQASCPAGTFNHGPFTPTPAFAFDSDFIEAYCHKTYAFDVTAGESYHFSTCPPGSATFDSALRAEDDPACNPVGVTNQNACGDDATIDYFATYTGRLYVTVSDELGLAGGNYTLAYRQENEAPANGNCGDGVDNDGDGFADEADPDCGSCTNDLDDDGDFLADEADPNCGGSCFDGVDDDGDGFTDEADSNCGSCSNNIDDDGDGATDEADSNCGSCNNGLDDDGDSRTDEADADCGSCFNNIDDDGDGLGDEADSDCGSCSNGFDDDLDGLTDEADSDCGSCNNSLDDDSDGATDEADSNCGSCFNNVDDDGDGLGDEADPDCGSCSNGIDDDLDGATDEADSDCGSCFNNVDDDGDGLGDEADPDCGSCFNNVNDDLDGFGDENDPDCGGSCFNNVDDDLDGLGDEADSDCGSCSNNSDDDLDGFGDENDPDCGGSCFNNIDDDFDGRGDEADPDCGACNNNVDDDLDGVTDEADPDCGSCADGIDNDGDGLTDCALGGDPDCPCGPESSVNGNCGDLVDNDGDGSADASDLNCHDESVSNFNCADGVDNDGDGLVDCSSGGDPDCTCGPESTFNANCFDGIDNDGDGFTDAADPNCGSETETNFNCADGIDNDGDGLMDCSGAGDPDCDCGPESTSDGNCADGVDNDNDGFMDAADANCDVEAAANVNCGDAVDNDGDGLTDCMAGGDPDCACGNEIWFAGNCADGIDNDNDGFIDAADGGCKEASANANCADNLDNDADGLTDEADHACGSCSDNLDNDGDGLADCDDPNCDLQSCGAGTCIGGVCT